MFLKNLFRICARFIIFRVLFWLFFRVHIDWQILINFYRNNYRGLIIWMILHNLMLFSWIIRLVPIEGVRYWWKFLIIRIYAYRIMINICMIIIKICMIIINICHIIINICQKIINICMIIINICMIILINKIQREIRIINTIN